MLDWIKDYQFENDTFPLINQIKEANPDILVVTRHFPLHFHPHARAAAHAAEAAGQQGKFEEMVTMQFEGQKLWSGLGAGAADDVFEQYGEDLGLDMDAFNTYRNSDEARAKVTRDYQSGIAAGVNSTPTFMLQGRSIRASSVTEFQAQIDAAKELAVQVTEGSSSTEPVAE